MFCLGAANDASWQGATDDVPMNSPSIGYEDDTILSKSEVAQLQLVEAISLFTVEKFLPAITLAGAAEGIFGQLLQFKSELPTIKESTKAIGMLREKTGLAVMGTKSEQKIIDDWNATRNSLKHLIGSEDELLTINLCDEAYWMIRRGLVNAQKLQLPISNTQDFENWVILNANM